MNIQEDLKLFDSRLVELASGSGIGKSYLKRPESILVEAQSRDQYPELQGVLAVDALFMAVRQDGWRFTTIAQRQEAYKLPHFGDVEWVELVEPASRTNKAPAPHIKSVSFYLEDLSSIHSMLKARNIEPQLLEEGISVPVRGTGGSVIFTDVGLSYAAEEYVKSGLAKEVKL